MHLPTPSDIKLNQSGENTSEDGWVRRLLWTQNKHCSFFKHLGWGLDWDFTWLSLSFVKRECFLFSFLLSVGSSSLLFTYVIVFYIDILVSLSSPKYLPTRRGHVIYHRYDVPTYHVGTYYKMYPKQDMIPQENKMWDIILTRTDAMAFPNDASWQIILDVWSQFG